MIEAADRAPSAADNARIVAFLAESLVLWRVEGSVEVGVPPVVAVIRARDGAAVWVERPPADEDFRWFVRWRSGGDVPEGAGRERARPCASLVGLLNAVRNAVGVRRGEAVRIAAPQAGA